MSLSPISGSPAPIVDLVAFSPSPAGGNPVPDLPVAPAASGPVPPVPQQPAPAPAPAAKQIQIDTEPIRSDDRWAAIRAGRLVASKGRDAMTAEGRFGWTLLVSMVLWLPSLRQTLADKLAVPDAMLRFSFALIAAYIAMGVIDWVLTTYHQTNALRVLEDRRREAQTRAEATALAEAEAMGIE